MLIPFYQVDAFTDVPLAGNPAAVMMLEGWPSDTVLQRVAAENNLSETAFVVPAVSDGADFDLRWFTPAVEVDLCGHATLAAAHVLFLERNFAGPTVRFATQSGILTVSRQDGRLVMDFPARPPRPHIHDDAVAQALGIAPRLFLKARDLVAVYDDAAAIRSIRPDFQALARLDHFAVIVTAPGGEAAGDGSDFVCRFFAPRAGVNEDPVTGSAFATLFPYWARRLGKSVLRARQISARGGTVWGRTGDGDRVDIAGEAVTVIRGEADLPV